MKTKFKIVYIISVIMLISMIYKCNAQEPGEERVSVNIYTEFQLYKIDGFNIGAAIELQEPLFYVKAQTFYFPNLNGIDYLDVEGVVGMHYRSRWDDIRIFGGVKLGAIQREGWGHPKWGWEIGFDFFIESDFFVGMILSGNRRTDGRVWESKADNYWSYDSGVRIGIILN